MPYKNPEDRREWERANRRKKVQERGEARQDLLPEAVYEGVREITKSVQACVHVSARACL